MLLPEIGAEGQRRIESGRVLMVGIGALGCVAADLLARAGVGDITLLDRDLVDWTNLQRQTLFVEADAREGVPKAEAAAARLQAVNSGIKVRAIVRDMTAANAGATVEQVRPEVLVDGTDNFETRYLLNDVAVQHGLAYAYAGVVGVAGMSAVFDAKSGPCLRCIFETPAAPGSSPTCDTAGVLGPAVALVAGMQAAAILRWLVGRGEGTQPRETVLREVNAWDGSSRTVDLTGAKRAECPCCGLRRFEFLEGGEEPAAVLCGQRAVQVTPQVVGQAMDMAALAARLISHGSVSRSRLFVRCVLDGGMDLTVFPDGRAIVRGTTSVEVARSIYARLIGS